MAGSVEKRPILQRGLTTIGGWVRIQTYSIHQITNNHKRNLEAAQVI